MKYNLTNVGKAAFPEKKPEYQVRKTSGIIRSLLAIPWIDETQYRAIGAKEYSFSKPAFDIWVFIVKNYDKFSEYIEEGSSKREKQKIDEFVLEIIEFKKKLDAYLGKGKLDNKAKLGDKEESDDIGKWYDSEKSYDQRKLDDEEKLIRQEYQQLPYGDFTNVYMLFNEIYYSFLQHSDRIVARLKMNYMEEVNKEIDQVLSRIYKFSKPDDVTIRAEMYIDTMMKNIKGDSEKYIKIIE
ncbi:hypothetical protein [Sporosarcina sp. FSL K6-5500]|uniref:hypothetical protein n=1 Tax=Sporosarcina sp. FSL K6-5500 TaxID=2921558 RepID=UPI0030FAC9FF